MKAVRDNDELKMIIQLLLKVGNFLNQGGNKPPTQSFNLDFFQKINLTKGVGKHSKSTLMEFLVLNVFEHSTLSFAIKLQKAELATKIDLASLQ
jgi:hypothetical protein